MPKDVFSRVIIVFGSDGKVLDELDGQYTSQSA